MTDTEMLRVALRIREKTRALLADIDEAAATFDKSESVRKQLMEQAKLVLAADA